MSLYDNQKCPVCGVLFKEGDDVVTCPSCGTPHHRECYEKHGRCANESLHIKGFVYNRHEKEEKSEPTQPESRHQRNPFDPLNKNQQPGAEQQNANNHTQQGSPFIAFQAPGTAGNIPSGYIVNKNEKIDGVSVADEISTIGPNFMKFIEKFRRGKKVNWNWSAFIFGPYYLFFRKMYKPGILFIAIEFIARLVVSVVYQNRLTTFLNGASQIMGNSSAITAEQSQKIAELTQSTGITVPTLIVFFAIIAVHVIIAMISDNLYRKRVAEIVKGVDEKLASGADITMNPLMNAGSDLPQSEMRRLFLASKGGVSFFAPCIAYFAIGILQSLMNFF